MDFIRHLFIDQRYKMMLEKIRALESENRNLRKINTQLVNHLKLKNNKDETQDD